MTEYVVAQEEGQAGRNCEQLESVQDVAPNTPGQCEDCIREGSRWVHLRLCHAYGHVGCCDNSPRRHATAHWHSSGHPIIRSLEQGEDWGWCYADELVLVPSES